MIHKTTFHSLCRAFLIALFTVSLSIIVNSQAIAQSGAQTTDPWNCRNHAMTMSWSEMLDKVGEVCDINSYPLNTGGWITYMVPTSAEEEERLGCTHGKCRWAEAQYFLNGQWTTLALWSGYFSYNSLKWWVAPELLGTATQWRWRTLEKRGSKWFVVWTTNTFYMPKRPMTEVVCFTNDCPQQ